MPESVRRLHTLICLCPLISFLYAACSSYRTPPVMITSTNADPGITVSKPTTEPPTQTTSPTLTAQPTSSPSFTSTPQPSITPAIQASQTPTSVLTPSITPTYAILRGTVLEQANCRYGPGAAYLYKYGLYSGNNLEVIGRNDTGNWVIVQAIGGSNPCWIKASLMDIHGDLQRLEHASLPLPQSPYYGPVTGASSVREAAQVIISWNPINLRAGDDSLQYPYLVEAWLCQAGTLTFEAIGSWETILTVTDEPGCSDPSHARIYGVEKHGYTSWVTIPWTQP